MQIRGFLNVFGSICGPCYNTSVVECIYYLAIVKYKKSDDCIRTKVEPFLHAVPLIVANDRVLHPIIPLRTAERSMTILWVKVLIFHVVKEIQTLKNIFL